MRSLQLDNPDSHGLLCKVAAHSFVVCVCQLSFVFRFHVKPLQHSGTGVYELHSYADVQAQGCHPLLVTDLCQFFLSEMRKRKSGHTLSQTWQALLTCLCSLGSESVAVSVLVCEHCCERGGGGLAQGLGI